MLVLHIYLYACHFTNDVPSLK